MSNQRNYNAELKDTKDHKYAYGFDESQSLVSYFHCTPNNTLSIIWNEYRWLPIFPRFATIRMDEAREFKKEIAFVIYDIRKNYFI